MTLKSEMNDILEQYQKYLEQKGHRNGYIQEHLGFLRFFGNNYLMSYNPRSILEIDEFVIKAFLGEWCIRKVMDFNKSDIVPMLRIFKKFTSFLFHTKKISENRYRNMKKECKNFRYYVEKLERNRDLDPNSEHWSEDFNSWLCEDDVKTEVDFRRELESLIDFEMELIEKISQASLNKSFTVVDDFKTFMNYLSEHKNGLRLTNNLFCLKRKDILKLNSMMDNPENLDQNVLQIDTILIHFFFLVSKRLGFSKYTRNMNFISTSLWDYYLKLPIENQYWILFRGLWDKINWYRLNKYSESGRPRGSFAERYSHSRFFSTLKSNGWISYRELIHLYDEFVRQGYKNALKNNYFINNNRINYFCIFPEKILPLLIYFRLFKIDNQINNQSLNELDLFEESKLRISSLGHHIFSMLKPLDGDVISFTKRE